MPPAHPNGFTASFFFRKTAFTSSASSPAATVTVAKPCPVRVFLKHETFCRTRGSGPFHRVAHGARPAKSRRPIHRHLQPDARSGRAPGGRPAAAGARRLHAGAGRIAEVSKNISTLGFGNRHLPAELSRGQSQQPGGAASGHFSNRAAAGDQCNFRHRARRRARRGCDDTIVGRLARADAGIAIGQRGASGQAQGSLARAAGHGQHAGTGPGAGAGPLLDEGK